MDKLRLWGQEDDEFLVHHSADEAIENVLESLDEEYGDPNGDGHEATEAMKEAEQTFLKTVLSDYRSWACERTGESVSVNAVEWVREHRPDWLPNKEGP